jgi:hypothetical protein
MDLKEIGCKGVDWIGLNWQCLLADSCEHSNEPSSSIKCRKFLD